MLQCQNCGQVNNTASNFCRFCGVRMVMPQNAGNVQDDFMPPPTRPYMWKTDEFQVGDNSARHNQNIRQVQPIAQQPLQNQAITQSYNNAQPAFYGGTYRCPRCGTQNPPFYTRRISAAGWIVFAILLLLTGIFFWIGLLIREDVRVCSVCGLKN